MSLVDALPNATSTTLPSALRRMDPSRYLRNGGGLPEAHMSDDRKVPGTRETDDAELVNKLFANQSQIRAVLDDQEDAILNHAEAIGDIQAHQDRLEKELMELRQKDKDKSSNGMQDDEASEDKAQDPPAKNEASYKALSKHVRLLQDQYDAVKAEIAALKKESAGPQGQEATAGPHNTIPGLGSVDPQNKETAFVHASKDRLALLKGGGAVSDTTSASLGGNDMQGQVASLESDVAALKKKHLALANSVRQGFIDVEEKVRLGIRSATIARCREHILQYGRSCIDSYAASEAWNHLARTGHAIGRPETASPRLKETMARIESRVRSDLAYWQGRIVNALDVNMKGREAAAIEGISAQLETMKGPYHQLSEEIRRHQLPPEGISLVEGSIDQAKKCFDNLKAQDLLKVPGRIAFQATASAANNDRRASGGLSRQVGISKRRANSPSEGEATAAKRRANPVPISLGRNGLVKAERGFHVQKPSGGRVDLFPNSSVRKDSDSRDDDFPSYPVRKQPANKPLASGITSSTRDVLSPWGSHYSDAAARKIQYKSSPPSYTVHKKPGTQEDLSFEIRSLKGSGGRGSSANRTRKESVSRGGPYPADYGFPDYGIPKTGRGGDFFPDHPIPARQFRRGDPKGV